MILGSFTLIEAAGGYIANSIALLAEAAHCWRTPARWCWPLSPCESGADRPMSAALSAIAAISRSRPSSMARLFCYSPCGSCTRPCPAHESSGGQRRADAHHCLDRGSSQSGRVPDTVGRTFAQRARRAGACLERPWDPAWRASQPCWCWSRDGRWPIRSCRCW